MTVVGDFSVRGGISTTVTATYDKKSARTNRLQQRSHQGSRRRRR
jgi:NADPH-dependent 7-cyano-7-deazaguanine reductase QueF